MGKLYDFESYKIRKDVKSLTQNKGLVYEVYLSTVKYIHKYIDITYENPKENLTTDVELEEIFQGDRDLFLQTFADLIQYWGIEPMPNHDIPYGKEFVKFKTIGDLCSYIEERVNLL
ncbi:hypothetical protein MUN89_15160 [Halobacillus salinarum]|uniref:Uncharacterized protein n=1 Tax=Halobacillus salinarum TaxID=2932257 RepID=A0ABY4EI08_9BACI|nr:hypothetical protein [Halobacillus salinarum]UOQ43259.1 hypothetical protein MUN89_15160 [Halobacillus salinarum]